MLKEMGFVELVEERKLSEAMRVFDASTESAKCMMSHYGFKGGKHVLHIFRSHHHISTFLKYISSARLIDAADDYLDTPLIKATKRQNIKVVKLLLSRNADVNAKDVHGMSPLTMSAVNGWHEGFVAMLQTNPPISASQHDFISQDNPGIVKTMIEYLSNTNGFTPYASSTYMHAAVLNDDNDLVGIVLKNTPDVSVLCERKLYVRNNEMAAFLTSRKIHFSIYYPMVEGFILPIQIYLLCHNVKYDDMKNLLHSPKYVEIFELFITMGSREEIRDRMSLICNLQPFKNYGRIERVEWIAEVSGVVSSTRPSLTNVSYFQLKCYQIRERMKELKKRIELSQVTGDWRNILN